MKATMMKVSDPIIFGHAVKLFFSDVFEKHQVLFDEIGINTNNGYGNVLEKVAGLETKKRQEIEADFKAAIVNGPDLAMVNSDKGITNLHVPSHVIIDASMPAMIRTSGKMWNPEGKLQDKTFFIQVNTGIYSATIDFCKNNTEPLIQLLWVQFLMLDLWHKKQKSTDLTTKLLKSLLLEQYTL